MPIYKGLTPITTLKHGSSTISNVYHGTVPVFNAAQLPYRVNITGASPINTYATGINNWEQFMGANTPLYFSIDNNSNSGAYWYGILLDPVVFNWMSSVNNDNTTFSMTIDGWHNFISLYIGCDITNTDFSNFTINNPFYALNLNEWDSITQQPKDPTNTHTWVFTKNYTGYYYAEYRLLDSSDFNYIGGLIQSGAELVDLELAPLGIDFSNGIAISSAFLLVSQQINFDYVANIPMAIEWLTNNGTTVASNVIQSNTNNFNFNIYSKLTPYWPEIQQLGWDSGMSLNILQIANYTPPTYNVPGTLELNSVSLNNQGENE